MPDVLRACPFCGCQDLDTGATNPWTCWVECRNCSCEGPFGDDREAAIIQWNRRVSDRRVSALESELDTAEDLIRELREASRYVGGDYAIVELVANYFKDKGE